MAAGGDNGDVINDNNNLQIGAFNLVSKTVSASRSDEGSNPSPSCFQAASGTHPVPGAGYERLAQPPD